MFPHSANGQLAVRQRHVLAACWQPVLEHGREHAVPRKPLRHCLARQPVAGLSDPALHGEVAVPAARAHHHGRSCQRRLGSGCEDVQEGLLTVYSLGMQRVGGGCGGAAGISPGGSGAEVGE